ncbi:hypothetical protein CEXT_606261 [Caerostris extrusa]|uniref:Uncharacterized protein n=1 Tax=Caerostris extrusa TaxID=172846 RepID=A0AAV4PEG0_CAEEX|nr:hypothetical protein CEXT_606261 [Caerostris extrusa]
MRQYFRDGCQIGVYPGVFCDASLRRRNRPLTPKKIHRKEIELFVGRIQLSPISASIVYEGRLSTKFDLLVPKIPPKFRRFLRECKSRTSFY